MKVKEVGLHHVSEVNDLPWSYKFENEQLFLSSKVSATRSSKNVNQVALSSLNCALLHDMMFLKSG